MFIGGNIYTVRTNSWVVEIGGNDLNLCWFGYSEGGTSAPPLVLPPDEHGGEGAQAPPPLRVLFGLVLLSALL